MLLEGYVIRSHSIVAGASAADEDLEGLVKWVSIYAKGADIRFSLTGTATSTSMFIGSGERLSFRIPFPGVSLSCIRDASTTGSLEVIEYG